MSDLNLTEWCESINPDSMIFAPSLELRREHELSVGAGHCNDSAFGCEVVMALRNVFGGRWPSRS